MLGAMIAEVLLEGVLPAVALMGLGAYLEYRFGSKLAARVAALEAKVHGAEAAVKADVSKASAAVDAAKKAA